MRTEEFKKYLQDATYKKQGQEVFYTPNAIKKRISSLEKVEKIFNFDIDTIIKNKEKTINLLVELRMRKLENLAHTPLSNAVRHYYKFTNGQEIGKIF